MAINFADVVSKNASSVERPPLPPVGTYRWRITKLPEQSTSNDGKWDIVTFNVRAVSAEDDVDTDDYKGDIANIIQQQRFMFNKEDETEFDKSLFRLKTFLLVHCVVGSESDTIGQLLNASVNAEFLGTIAWRQDKNDPEVMYAGIGRTAPLD